MLLRRERITEDVQGSVRASGGGVRPGGQRQLRTQDAAASLQVVGRWYPGVRYHRVVAQHLFGGRQEPEGTQRET